MRRTDRYAALNPLLPPTPQASRVVSGGGPPESSFTAIFAMGAVTGLIALLLIAASRPRLRDIESIDELTDSRAMNHEWG